MAVLHQQKVILCVFTSELCDPWIDYPKSPIVRGDANMDRPRGRVLVFDGRVFRYAQDDEPVCGTQVRAFEITELTTTDYE